ncbi:septal ring lytic transglycosylase RlpA family protein [Granulosicoccus antarcticus]|uniref:Endolytic peptidoglycan transglycosylase RlpA n=1 Tax=Granulosicoccus antarcticus IMCC3135 TaxID=1192854 RepID=A0A2Z2NYH8_9GAMM|nr:septal ring lytic transglycosylase RlpA family protein [Granulosicoccus antarcticus]ASJ72204.1 RlpA-like protein [Granulosicoccus antarcticus IMCC3135]
MKMLTLRVGVCLLAAGLTSSCSAVGAQPAWKLAVAGDGPGDPASLSMRKVIVENLPKSRYGNATQYKVFGKDYQVLDSAEGFKERGVASWYGKKFHGRPTSSGEPYDMHLLTAAHKHLPLPTFVRVTRVDTGQSIVVKVNDRGPFVEDRIIDLSYAAAVELDMLEQGKTEVFIEALSTHEPEIQAEAEVAPPKVVVVQAEVASPAEALSEPLPEPLLNAESEDASEWTYLQVGAFANAGNAETMLDNLQNFLAEVPAEISHDAALNLFRVRIGPLSSEQSMKDAQSSLTQAGIQSYKVISANP